MGRVNIGNIIYFNVSKVSGKVPHEFSLESYGLDGPKVKEVHNRLANYTYRVRIKACTPNWRTVTSVTPQGIVWEQYYSIFVFNDLDNGTDWQFFRLEMWSTPSRKEWDRLEDWTEKNKKSINREKCKILHLGKKNIKLWVFFRINYAKH